MPHSFNANWLAATADAAKAPAYFIRVEGLGDRQYSTAPVRGATKTTFVLLEVPDAVGQRIDQLRGRSTLQITKLKIVDNASDFTNVIATERPAAPIPTLVNRRIDLYSGYMTLIEGHYERIVRGQILSVSMLSDGETYELKIVDLKRTTFDDVFTNAEAQSLQRVNTTIAVQVAAGEERFTVVDINGIRVEDKLFLGKNVIGEEEKVEVRAIEGLTVRIKGTLSFTHQVGTRVRWATTVIEGNPINILYAVQTGDFANPTFPLDEVLGLPTGLGIDPLDIATADLVNERDNFYADEVWRFEIKRETPGLRFLESKIHRFLGYPFTTADGRLSFRMYRPAYAEDAVAGLTQITKKEIGSWKWERAVKLHVNRVKLGLDLNPETGDPATVETYERDEDVQDQIDSKEIVTIEEEDTGIRISLRGLRLGEERGQVLLRRFNPPPVQLRIFTDLRFRALEVGEVVEITHDEIPNMDTGQRGLTKKRVEIVERSELFGSELVSLVVQDANFNRPSFIAPDTAPDYDAATDAEHEYCYIAPDKADLNLNFTSPSGEAFAGYEKIINIRYPHPGHGPDGNITLGWLATVGTFETDRDNPSSPDERFDSSASVASPSRLLFRIDRPNGKYLIRAVGGDPTFQTSAQSRLTMNGVVFWDTTFAGEPLFYQDVTLVVPVTGGKIEIELQNNGSGAGGLRSYLNFVSFDLGDALPFADGGIPYQII